MTDGTSSLSSEAADPDEPDRDDGEAIYWCEVFKTLGMIYPQALTLAFDPAVDKHAVREVLEKGCRPELAFRIYASWE